MFFFKHGRFSKLKEINQSSTNAVRRDYSNWSSVKNAINEKRSDKVQRDKKRTNHWKDFLGNVVKLKFVDYDIVSSSPDSSAVESYLHTNDTKVKGIFLTNEAESTEFTACSNKNMITALTESEMKLTKNTKPENVLIKTKIATETEPDNVLMIARNVPVKESITPVNDDFPLLKSTVNEADIEQFTTHKIATANSQCIALSISKFFDKKIKTKPTSLSIYSTECPCQRCQTIRRVNQMRRNQQLNCNIDNQKKL